jgi:catechol 2,3-dioxygenase-like lactoylglutathione lyase family enzyme
LGGALAIAGELIVWQAAFGSLVHQEGSPMTPLASAKAVSFIVTRDRAAAKAFYGATLGFALKHEDHFAAVYDLNGTMLRISTLPDHVAQRHTVLGWDVPDIAAAVAALRDKGVAFTVYEGMGQDDSGIWTAPGSTAKVAWFKDPDGNVLSLTQF